MTDEYQRRYLEHRERKARAIAGAPAFIPSPHRRSVRVFDGGPSKEVLRDALEVARHCPQSCNRQALILKVVNGAPVGDWLLGGKGWAGKAPTLILVFADLVAYKAPGEQDFMPWLDAGVMLATLHYAADAQGLSSCIINPVLREEHMHEFCARFNRENRLFCGALAIGYAAGRPAVPEKKPIEELVEWV